MTDDTQPEALRALAEAATWTGKWYDAGCNTVHCTYDKEDSILHDEIAHPVPFGVSGYIAAAHPQAVIALLDRIAELESELEAVGAGGVQALSAAPAAFLKSVIALCSHRGYSPANIEAWDKDDKWIADLWRQAEAMLAASLTPTAEQQAAPKAATGEQVNGWPVEAKIYKRRDEWVLELSGVIQDCAFTCRHTQPGYLQPEDVAGLPSLYSEGTAPQPAPAPLSDDAKDAARYRWLRINAIGAFRTNDGKGPVSVYHLSKIPAIPGIPEETDAAIDAALAAQGGKV